MFTLLRIRIRLFTTMRTLIKLSTFNAGMDSLQKGERISRMQTLGTGISSVVRNGFEAGKILYEGQWKGWALEIENFLGPEMATSEPT
jgi:hypothetical protein